MSTVPASPNTRNDGQNGLTALDWSEKNTNDVLTAMLTRLPTLCWLELNADWPNGLFYHPGLAVQRILRIGRGTLRGRLGGGSLWGKGVGFGGSFFRATRAARLKRSTATGDNPVFVFLEPSGRGSLHPFEGPG